MIPRPLAACCLAETLGTFLLVFFGCGSVHVAVLIGDLAGLWQVGIVWGVSIMLAIYELAPKASRPVRVVRTAYIEADGVPLPDPDPANIEKREFAWMTVHHYQADKPFKLPFKDLSTLTVDWANQAAP